MGDLDPREELFALGGKGNPFMGSKEQLAAKGILQFVYDARDIRLILEKNVRRFCKTLVLGGVVKDPIILIVNVHG